MGAITGRSFLPLHMLKTTLTQHSIYRGSYRVPFCFVFFFANIFHTTKRRTGIKQIRPQFDPCVGKIPWKKK